MSLRAALALLCLLAAAPAHADPAPTVILLSFDGVRADYLDRAGLAALQRIATQGARAEALRPVFPALTFPSHVSLATGAPVDRHGIVANRFFDDVRGEFDYDNDASWILAEPLWVTAERQGVRSAAFFWVGSETDWNGVGASYRRTPFNGRLGEDEKVDQIVAWLDLPEAERPRLIVSWWHGADRAGHGHGPEGERTRAQLEGQDRVLARLLGALDERAAWPHTTLLVVSDHGMTEVTEALDPKAPLSAAGIEAEVVAAGGLAHVRLADPAMKPAAAEALAQLPGVEVHATDALPAALRYGPSERIGDLLVIASPPRRLSEPWTAPDTEFRFHRLLGRTVGGHGYRPDRVPAMDGILVAMGRGVAAGARLPRASALDVAPTVTRLLGIEPPAQAEGRPIEGIGEPLPSAP